MARPRGTYGHPQPRTVLNLIAEDAGERRTIEVLDRAGYETMQRLAAAGLIPFSTDAVRELYPEPQPAEVPPQGLPAEAVARIGELSGMAAHHLRLAEVLHISQFVREARAPLEAAALALSRGLAVAAGASERGAAGLPVP